MARHEMRDRILKYISDRCDTDGCPPSYREIASAVGLQSPSSVARHVRVLQREGKLESVYSAKGRTLRLKRRIDLDAGDRDNVQRVRIETADGGFICLDCNLEKTGSDAMGVSFSGILDASQLKSSISRVVRCSVDDGNQ